MNRRLSLLSLLALAAILMAACAGEAPTEEATEAPAEETEAVDAPADETEVAEETEAPAEEEPTATEEAAMVVEGDVVIDGSSTVFPLATAIAEEFMALYPDARVSVGEAGTGGGFERFCAGETDISNASRAIKDTEAEVCAANNIEYLEMLVGLDGLTVVVNPTNDWATCLTQEQLVQLFAVNSTAVNWSDIDASWPAEPIKFFVPDPDSGTRDFMIETLAKTDETVEDIRQDDNTTASADDNNLLTGVANDEYAIGFFGYAYYANAEGAVNALEITNKDGECVAPSDETVSDGSYNPLSRPLYIYPSSASLVEKPQVAAFVRYFMEEGLELVIGDVGYSLPPAGTTDENLSLLEALLGQ